jgi:hypothetical protein
MLCELAMSYNFEGQPPKAVQCFQQAVNLFKEQKNQEAQGIALNNLSVLLSSRG